MEDVIEPSPQTSEDLSEKIQSDEIIKFADITFEVEGKELLASKTCLSMISPVFKSMFERTFKEAFQAKIPLPSKSFGDFMEFINVTHIGTPVSEKNVFKVLPLAHEYCCEGLLTRCEEVLLKLPPSMLLFSFASIYNLEDMYKKCLKELLKKDFAHFKKHYLRSHYEDLDIKAKVEYLETKLKAVESENEGLKQSRAILDEINTVMSTTLTKTVCCPAALTIFRRSDDISWPHFEATIVGSGCEISGDHLAGGKMYQCKRCDAFKLLTIGKLLGIG